MIDLRYNGLEIDKKNSSRINNFKWNGKCQVTNESNNVKKTRRIFLCYLCLRWNVKFNFVHRINVDGKRFPYFLSRLTKSFRSIYWWNFIACRFLHFSPPPSLFVHSTNYNNFRCCTFSTEYNNSRHPNHPAIPSDIAPSKTVDVSSQSPSRFD